MDGSDKYVGRILDNRYEILELIGAGGMANVYKARCHRLNRLVAVKILKEDLSGDEDFRRRFHTESQAVAMLSHPNIVAVYDVSHSGNIEYIVMELIEGISLKQYINRKGLLSWKEALHFATLITKALTHAHSRGIIHRDIKPHNIMILKDGSVKVADFGIARLLSMQNTLTQQALGSVHYISPEQAKGGYVDARTDIYSLGVVMYEMLTSRLPFVGDSPVSVAIQHISAIPLMPSDINPEIPAGLEDITMHAMEPDLDMRFMTADEMLNDLEDFRKNPAVMFNYVTSEPHIRQSDDDEYEDEYPVDQATKVMPLPVKEAVNAGGNAARPERPAQVRKKKATAARKPEMTQDEYRKVKGRASSTSTLVGIFSIILFIVVVLVFMWNYILKDIFNPTEPEMITIPTFVGQKYDDVKANADYRDLYTFAESYEVSDEHPAGTIIQQNPQAERQQTAPAQGKKTEIKLVVAQDPPEHEPAPMPELIGKHFSEANNIIESLGMGLKIELDGVIDEKIPKGFVFETIPVAGVSLLRGHIVVIRYSLGAEIIMQIVPDLVGHTRVELESAFETLGLIPDFRPFASDTEEGTITFIAKIGDEVAEGTKIVVHVSVGPSQPPTDEPPTDEPPTDEPPTDEPPTDEPPTDEPPTDEPPTDEPPTDEPPTDAPPTDAPPTDAPPTDPSPSPSPSTETPPTDNPSPEAQAPGA